jgi:hypothetical protein
MLFLHKFKFSKLYPKINLYAAAQFCFGLGIFLLPLRIRSLLYLGDSYTLGFFDEYLAFFVHANEILFFLAFLLLGIVFIRKPLDIKNFALPPTKLLLPFLILLTASIITVPFSVNPFLALLLFFRMLEFALIALFISSKIFSFQPILRILLASVLLQSVLAIAQFLAKGELGLHFMGESFFTAETFNVAKMILPSGEVLVRGMGMLPHANILGGIAAITLLLFASLRQKNSLAYFAAVMIFTGMFFSFSRAALLAFFVGIFILLIFQFRRRIISAFAITAIFVTLLSSFGLPFFVRTQSHSENPDRLKQISQALEIAHENILGVGRGNYTMALTQIQPNLKFYQLQPVHNFFALKIAEESALVGLAWLGIFASLAWWCLRKQKYEALAVLVAIFILANFDHYFSTNFTAKTILWLALAFVVLELVEEKPRFRKNVVRNAEL